jgi:hypothetical protein
MSRRGGYKRHPRVELVVAVFTNISEMNRTAGDHKGQPNSASSSLTPTDIDRLFRVMPGRANASALQEVEGMYVYPGTKKKTTHAIM